MAGRPKLYEDDVILDKAIEVFRDKCYDAASTDELLEAMGIGKSSFYLNFKGGKEELYQRTLHRFAETLNKKIETEMESSGDSLGYIKNLFLKMANLPAAQKDRGCPYGNALVQLSVNEQDTRQLAADYLKHLHLIFLKAIKNAQSTGQIAKDKNAERLAWHLLTFWNGIHITKRIQKSPSILKDLIEDNFSLLT
jgi:TetR/AcrR family transcriptional repressor of nem operon